MKTLTKLVCYSAVCAGVLAFFGCGHGDSATAQQSPEHLEAVDSSSGGNPDTEEDHAGRDGPDRAEMKTADLPQFAFSGHTLKMTTAGASSCPFMLGQTSRLDPSTTWQYQRVPRSSEAAKAASL